MASAHYSFGRFKIDPKEVFYHTSLSYAMVNLRPLLPDVLVCPKREVQRVADLTADETCDLWLAAQRVGCQLELYHKASSLTFAIQDGPQAGQTVPHVHIHIIPRKGGDFEKNDEIYDAIDVKEKELNQHLDLDKERKDRNLEEMAQEADEYRKLFFLGFGVVFALEDIPMLLTESLQVGFKALDVFVRMASSSRQKHYWTKEEEELLVMSLLSLVNTRWHASNGTFRAGYQQKVLDKIQASEPDTMISKYSIECKVKTMKKHYTAIKEMLGSGCNGFAWSESRQCIDVDKETFDNWVKSHPNARGLWMRPFPHYQELSIVFGSDRVIERVDRTPNSARSTTAAALEVAQEVEAEEEIDPGSHSYDLPETLPQDIPAIDTPMDDDMNGTPLRCNGSGNELRLSESKRKRIVRNPEIVDIMRNAVQMHDSRMSELVNWQEHKRQMESSARKEAMTRIKTLPYLTKAQKRTVITVVCMDMAKIEFFLDMDSDIVEDYCMQILVDAGSRR